MSRVAVVTFLWGTRYNASYVNKLYAGLKRHSDVDFDMYCFIDRKNDQINPAIRKRALWFTHGELGRCYRRLRMLSTAVVPLIPADRYVMIDLDTVVVGDVTPLLTITEPNVAVWKAKSIGPQGYALNPSFMSLKPGASSHIYDTFAKDPKTVVDAARIVGWTGSDQAVLSHYLTQYRPLGVDEGLYSYRDDSPTPLPAGARLVSFYGDADPSYNHVQNSAPWIKEHWRE